MIDRALTIKNSAGYFPGLHTPLSNKNVSAPCRSLVPMLARNYCTWFFNRNCQGLKHNTLEKARDFQHRIK